MRCMCLLWPLIRILYHHTNDYILISALKASTQQQQRQQYEVTTTKAKAYIAFVFASCSFVDFVRVGRVGRIAI